MKKILYLIILMILVFPNYIHASNITLLKVGNKYYDNLQDAIDNVVSNETIYLITNLNLTETININKTVNINLNGNTIEAKNKVFLIEGGSLNLSGKGLIKETEPYYGAIMIKGSQNSDDLNYSTLKVDKEVTLEGWSGIFINHNNSKSYGVLINFNGKINATNDIYGASGTGIYINGSIVDDNNPPIININSGSSINSTGVGLYLAGSSIVNIDNANINGKASAISIKSGKLNIKSGNLYCNGIDNTPTTGNNNGINPSGATIQIESNSGYASNIEININGGTLTSKNSHVIYEYIGKGNNTQVNKINLNGGIYNSNKEMFSFSESLINKHNKFIKGGKYQKNPDKYLLEGYASHKVEDYYEVIKSTMKEENIISNKTSNKIVYILFPIVILLIIYLNKNKILKLIKFRKQN